jgi:hypothetical protein
MSESLESWIARWRFSFAPAYFGTGGVITYIACDWQEVRVKIPLSWRTINYVGSIYGGSLYAAVDPWYMMILINTLGPDYIVRDKAATIKFIMPGRSTPYARFLINDKKFESIKSMLANKPKLNRIFMVNLADENGSICASVRKTISIRKK